MHSFARHRHNSAGKAPAKETKGLVLSGGWRYDLMVGGSSMQELAALITDAGFEDLGTEEMQPARFSTFHGAGIVRSCKG